MFGYEFSSIIVEKSTRNQVTDLHCGYEWTSRVQVDLVTSRSGYELTRNRSKRMGTTPLSR